MTKFTVIASAAIVCCMVSFADVFAQDGKQETPYIEVSGSAQMEVLPDQILLDIVVKERELKGGMKLADMEKTVVELLASLGIDAKEALAIDDVDAVVKKHFIKSNEVNEVRSYTIKLSSASQLVSVMDALRKQGVMEMNLSDISLSQAKEDEYRLEILAKAATRAKAEANAIACALEVELDKPLVVRKSHVNIDGGTTMVRMANMPMASDMLSTEGGYIPEQTSLNFSKLTISATVSIKYGIVAK